MSRINPAIMDILDNIYCSMLAAIGCAIIALLIWCLRQIYIIDPRHHALHQAQMAAYDAITIEYTPQEGTAQ